MLYESAKFNLLQATVAETQNKDNLKFWGEAL